MTSAPKTDDYIWYAHDRRADHSRFTILPGCAATDERLRLVHFRILTLVGRFNTAGGRVRFSQTHVAADFGIRRETVSRAIRDLVAWGYLEREGQAETGGVLCLYRIRDDAGCPPRSESKPRPRTKSDQKQRVTSRVTPSVTSRVTHVCAPESHSTRHARHGLDISSTSNEVRNFTSSPELDAPRAKHSTDELRKQSVRNLSRWKQADPSGIPPDLIRLCGGLGVPVEMIEADCAGPGVRNPGGMFRTKAEKWLGEQLPGIDRRLVASALKGVQADYTSVLNLMSMRMAVR